MRDSYTKILKSDALIQKFNLYINVRTFIYMEMKYDAGYFKNDRDRSNWKYNSLQKMKENTHSKLRNISV